MNLISRRLSLKGRIDRRTFALWGGAAALLTAVSAAGPLLLFIGLLKTQPPLVPKEIILAPIAVMFAAYWAYMAQCVKRLHDLGFSGVFAAASLVGLTSGGLIFAAGHLILFLVLLLSPGQTASNRYGAPP